MIILRQLNRTGEWIRVKTVGTERAWYGRKRPARDTGWQYRPKAGR